MGDGERSDSETGGLAGDELTSSMMWSPGASAGVAI